MSHAKILGKVERYYSEKVAAHGATARGVDWNSTESQRLRFDQLLKVCDRHRPFIINDYGCGYGALADHLRDEECSFHYRGFDISPPMIARAKELHSAMTGVGFVSAQTDLAPADYTVASGIFNVKLQTPPNEWESYILKTLGVIDS